MERQPQNRQNLLTINLSTILLLVTICSILVAWFVDHKNLDKQIIKQQQSKSSMAFKLSNVSATNAVLKLESLYPNQKFYAGTANAFPAMTNSEAEKYLLVVADDEHLEPIRFIVEQLELNGTGYEAAAGFTLKDGRLVD